VVSAFWKGPTRIFFGFDAARTILFMGTSWTIAFAATGFKGDPAIAN
jgi:hypothetical protein